MCADFAVLFSRLAFKQTKHSELASAATAILPLTNRFVHISRSTADVRLIDFDCRSFTAHLRCSSGLLIERETDSMIHEPCRLLGNAGSACDLVRGNAVLAVHHHPHRHKPLVEADG